VIETSSFLCLHTSIHNFLRCGIGCNLKLKFFSVHGICLYLQPIKLYIISIFFYYYIHFRLSAFSGKELQL
jgi:hypothetical protein